MATSHSPLCPTAAAAALALWLLSPLAAAQGSATPPPPAAPPPAAPGATATPGAPAMPEAVGEAPAPRAPDAEPAWEFAPAVRRSGFTVGLAGGLLLGSAAGFPNDVKKIGLERYYTETGLAGGSATMIWMGGALTDWLTFGFALGSTALTAGEKELSNTTFMFHVEAFPLFSLGGRWRELGVTIDTGAGTSVTKLDGSDDNLIDGGTISHIGAGLFYEGFRVWKISAGPYLYGDYSWSLSARQPGLLLGVRTVLYTGAAAKR